LAPTKHPISPRQLKLPGALHNLSVPDVNSEHYFRFSETIKQDYSGILIHFLQKTERKEIRIAR